MTFYAGVGYSQTGLSAKPDGLKWSQGGRRGGSRPCPTSSWISGHVISIAVCCLVCPAVSLRCLQRTHSSPEAQFTISQVGLSRLCVCVCEKCMCVLFLLEDLASLWLEGHVLRTLLVLEERNVLADAHVEALPCLPKCLCANTGDKVLTR